jgi:hypothetical protein
MKLTKVLDRILRGASGANIDFNDLKRPLHRIGFQERIKVKCSHHIFWKEGVAEIINLQPKGSQANLIRLNRYGR